MSGLRQQMKDGFTKSPCWSSFKLIRNHILLFPLRRRLFTFSLRTIRTNLQHETQIIGFVSAAVTDWGTFCFDFYYSSFSLLCCVLLVAEFTDLLTDIWFHFLICVLLIIKPRWASLELSDMKFSQLLKIRGSLVTFPWLFFSFSMDASPVTGPFSFSSDEEAWNISKASVCTRRTKLFAATKDMKHIYEKTMHVQYFHPNCNTLEKYSGTDVTTL